MPSPRPSSTQTPPPPVSTTTETKAPRHDKKMSDHAIIFSANQPADLAARAASLFPTWQLSPSQKGVTRQYTFPSFSKAWEFMSLVADECKAKNHHPSWSNMYNKVTVEWTTHRPEGLSIKDVDMAEFCDRTANGIGLKK